MASVQNSLFCGYLFKRNPSGTWQKRYCIAFSNKIVYYKHKSKVERGSPQGTISFVNCTCTLPIAGDMYSHKKDFCFILRSNTSREFYWAAESKADLDKWHSILNIGIKETQATGTKVGPHSLKKVHFSKPTVCARCSSLIHGMGKQGFMCKVCLLCIHKKCEHKLGDYCLLLKDQRASIPSSPPAKNLFARLSQYNHPQATVGLDLKQITRVIEEFENEERILIEQINVKYDLQVNEIIDELYLRYQVEVQEVEEKANNLKRDLVAEIKLRENTLKRMSIRVA